MNPNDQNNPLTQNQRAVEVPQPPVTTVQPAFMQSRVEYYSGLTIASGQMALLEWDSNNVVRLFDLDVATGQATGLLFECNANQITKATATMSMLSLTVNSKRYRLEFSETAMPWLFAFGLIGFFISGKKTKESGIKWWIENLARQGVKTSSLYIGKILLWTALGILALSALLIVIIVIAS